MEFTVTKSDGPKMWSPSWTTTIRGPLFETVPLPAAPSLSWDSVLPPKNVVFLSLDNCPDPP